MRDPFHIFRSTHPLIRDFSIRVLVACVGATAEAVVATTLHCLVGTGRLTFEFYSSSQPTAETSVAYVLLLRLRIYSALSLLSLNKFCLSFLFFMALSF
jgi:hypothetical protein